MFDADEALAVPDFAPIVFAAEPEARAGAATVAVDEELEDEPAEETLVEDELGDDGLGEAELGESEELERPAGLAMATADEEPFPSDLSVDLATISSFSTGYICQPVNLW